MSGMIGADPEALDEMANWCEAQSRVISTKATIVNNLLHTAPWHGRHADEFRAAWSQSYHASMLRTAAFLQGAASTLRANAEQQREASQGIGGVSGGHLVATPHRAPPAQPRAVSHGGLSGWLSHEYHRTDQVVDKVESTGTHLAETGLKDADRVQHEVVSSRAFKDAIDATHIIGTVAGIAAPFLAGVPIVGEVVLGVAVAADLASTAGDAAEMADGVKKWNAEQLIGDGVQTVGVGIPFLSKLDDLPAAVSGGEFVQSVSTAVNDAGPVRTTLNTVDVLSHVYTIDDSSVRAYQAFSSGNVVGGISDLADAGGAMLIGNGDQTLDSHDPGIGTTNDQLSGGVATGSFALHVIGSGGADFRHLASAFGN